MKLKEAFEKWISLSPFTKLEPSHSITYSIKGRLKTFIEKKRFDGDCCNNTHFYKDNNGVFVPKPDSHVCPRERAWRDYIRIRDNIN